MWKNHPSILHGYRRENRSPLITNTATAEGDHTIETVAVSAVKHVNSETISLCVVPVYLYVKGNPEHRIKVYAMLDTCSQGTFIAEDLIENLKISTKRVANINVRTIKGEESNCN